MGLVDIIKNKIEKKREEKQKENSEKVEKETGDINKYIIAYEERINELNKVEIPDAFSDEEEIKKYFIETGGKEWKKPFDRYIKNREDKFLKKEFLFELLELYKDTGILEEKVNYMKKTIEKMQETNSPKYSQILENYFTDSNLYAQEHQNVCSMGDNSEPPELPEFLR